MDLALAVPSALLPMEADLRAELNSLLWIAAIAAAVPFIVAVMRVKIAEVVLLLGGGIIFGPQVLHFITIDDSISLLAQLGLGFLFFVAGMELAPDAIRGRSGRLAAIGWGVSLLLAGLVSAALQFAGIVQDFLGFAIVLTSTALGTLLPLLRDSGQLTTPFGRFFMGAGAWGEFGPILAISLLLSTRSALAAIVSIVVFGGIALIVSKLPGRFSNERVRELLDRGYSTSSQTAVRLTVLLLVGLLAIAEDFGLDVVLGAFIAGAIMRRYMPTEEEGRLQTRVEGMAFGIFIPLFFVVSGANLDIHSIIANPWPMVAVFVLLALVRGLPQYVIYRHAIPDPRERGRFALFVATGLPIIVAVTTVQVDAGVMTPNDAAELVGAGALSVLVFPLLGAWLIRRRQPDRMDATA
jgi:Kef-type K+ transport system membrane component KefB